MKYSFANRGCLAKGGAVHGTPGAGRADTQSFTDGLKLLAGWLQRAGDEVPELVEPIERYVR